MIKFIAIIFSIMSLVFVVVTVLIIKDYLFSIVVLVMFLIVASMFSSMFS